MVRWKVSSLTMVSMESDGGAVIGLEFDQLGRSQKLLKMSEFSKISKHFGFDSSKLFSAKNFIIF